MQRMWRNIIIGFFVEGKVIEEEEFEKLEESVKQHYEEKSTVVQQQIMEAIGQIKQIEREADKKVTPKIQQKPKQKAAAKRKKQQKKWRQTATDMLWLLIPMISQNMIR